MELIRTNLNLCTGCNRCVRECPMEPANITYQDEAGNIKVKVDSEKCVACGRCLTACKHNARYYADDTERFFADLAAGVPISLIAAPATRTNLPEWKRLFTFLKKKGVNKIYDVSLGADICIWSNIRHVEKSESSALITQPCPVIVTYIETYRHDLLEYLSPAQSPMACASVYMKEYMGITDSIAALSPCVAKTNEFSGTGLAQYSVTFTLLKEYLEKNNVELPDTETDFDHEDSGLGSIFPMPGGLKENIEFFKGKSVSIDRAEGETVFEMLATFAESPASARPRVFDVLNCHDGCNLGPASTHASNAFEINRKMDERRKAAAFGRKKEYFEELYKKYDETFDLEKFSRSYKPIHTPFPQLTEDDIAKSFLLLDKTDHEKQTVDCGACGSDTCHGMARKIALGINIPFNCMVKTMEDAKAEHALNIESQKQLADMEKKHETDELLRTMLDSNPFGANFWNRDHKLIDINEASINLFKVNNKREYIENFKAFSPRYQPDGRLSSDAAPEYIQSAFEKGSEHFEWMHQTLQGEEIPCEITMRRVAYDGDYIIAAYLRDLRDQKRMTSDIEKRDQLLNVINRLAAILLAAANEEQFGQFLEEGMEYIGKRLDADCVQIWPNERTDGALHFILKYKWASEVGKLVSPADIGTVLPCSASWEQAFLQGKYINGPVSILPEEYQVILRPLMLKSTITIPLFYNDQFWGIFSVDDCVKDHYYSEDEVAILHSASLMLVNAINRNLNRKELEAALSKAETAVKALSDAQLTTSAMFEANPQINILFDANFKAIDCNPAAVEFLGFDTKAELLGGVVRRIAESVPERQPDGRVSIPLSARLATAAAEGYINLDTELVIKGERKNLNVELKRIPYESGFAFVCYIHDMTAVREREKEIISAREQNEIQLTKLNLVLKATKIGLWEMAVVKEDPINPQNPVIYSDEFKHMLGFWIESEFPDVIGSMGERLHPDDIKKTGTALRDHLADVSGRTPFDVEFRLLKKDGEYSYYRATGETIRDEAGSPVHVAGSLEDITETKHILLDTEKQKLQAEAANQAKSMFLSTMSHEIRTPMNAILGITEIQLQRNGLEPEIMEGLEKIRTSSDMLLGIINDILDLSKIEAGKLELIDAKYETASLISDTAQLNMMRIGSKPIDFELNVDEKIPAAFSGDELRVKQILNNILSNAFKYTESGKVIMDVSSVDIESPRDKSCLIVKISDTGQGMTREQVEKLFDEYARFNHETNRTTEGTGLGMSITRNLIYMMKGEIAIESEPGRGSVFTVQLPQTRIGGETLGSEMAYNLRKFRTGSNSHMKRAQIKREPMPYGSVLIVDDVETNIYVARGLMAPYELITDSAESGYGAIEKVKNGNTYDIIFMDHMMPKMDGIETTKRLRDMGYNRAIVALTANAVSGQAEIFLGNGFDDYISKPIDVRQLNTVLNRLIRDKYPPEVAEAARRRAAENLPDADQPGVDPLFSDIFVRDARKTVSAMEGFVAKGGPYGEDDMRAFVIHTHGIKSALANIGEMRLSAVALKLEQYGRTNNTVEITSEVPSFINSLKALISGLSRSEDALGDEAENVPYLTDRLHEIKAACESYDEALAEEILTELMQRKWSRLTRGLLETISEKLLHSEFDEIIDTISGFMET